MYALLSFEKSQHYFVVLKISQRYCNLMQGFDNNIHVISVSPYTTFKECYQNEYHFVDYFIPPLLPSKHTSSIRSCYSQRVFFFLRPINCCQSNSLASGTIKWTKIVAIGFNPLIQSNYCLLSWHGVFYLYQPRVFSFKFQLNWSNRSNEYMTRLPIPNCVP